MKTLKLTTTLVLGLLAGLAQAQTGVADAWVRGTVPQQQGTGAFMRITSAQGARLVGVQSPVAAIAEIVELNIGHCIIARAIFSGLEAAVRDMKALMIGARP